MTSKQRQVKLHWFRSLCFNVNGNRGFARQPCWMAGTIDSFFPWEQMFFLMQIIFIFLPSNMAAVQNLYNNELALQHGGFCTTWSLVAKGLFNLSAQRHFELIRISSNMWSFITSFRHSYYPEHQNLLFFFGFVATWDANPQLTAGYEATTISLRPRIKCLWEPE